MWADLTNTFGQDELHSLTFVFNYKSSIFVTCDCFPDLISLLRMIPIHIDSLIILIFSWLSDISNKTPDYVQPQHWFSKPILLPNRYRIVAWWTSRSQKILYCMTVSQFPASRQNAFSYDNTLDKYKHTSNCINCYEIWMQYRLFARVSRIGWQCRNYILNM